MILALFRDPLFDKYYKDYDRTDTSWDDLCSPWLEQPCERANNALRGNLIRLQSLANQLFHLNPFQFLRTLAAAIKH